MKGHITLNRYLPNDDAPVYHQLFMMLIASMSFALILVGNHFLFFQFNKFHHPVLDDTFSMITLLGNGLTNIITAGICWIWLRKKKSEIPFQVLMSFVISGLCAQLLKAIFRAPRPSLALSEAAYPYFLKGISRGGFTSFPSGHTTTIFALCTILALQTKNRNLQVALFMVALMVAYSRIYLGSHFPVDILAGALLGYGSALLIINLKFIVKRVKQIAINPDRFPSES